MAYIEVSWMDIVSPVAEGLYEEDDGSYILSSDEAPIDEKTYYAYDDTDESDPALYAELELAEGDSVVGYYEFVDDEYVLTEDIVAQVGKTYYEYCDQSETDVPIDEDAFYYPVDAEANPVSEGLYEKNEEGYFLSEDTTVDETKTYYKALDDAIDDAIPEDDEDPVQSPEDYVDTGEIFPDSEEIPLVESEDFLYADMEFVQDPHAEELYEISSGAYVLTSDTEVVNGKVYYEYVIYSDYYVADMTGITDPSLSLENIYELLNGVYVLTEDTTVSDQKTYYRSHSDDENYYFEDPTVGEDPAEWDDIPYESEE